MIKSFKNVGTLDIAKGLNSSQARRCLPLALHSLARIRLVVVDRATSLQDMRAIPGYRLEKLVGKRAGQYSIRINSQYRICFVWNEQDALDLEIVDYH